MMNGLLPLLKGFQDVRGNIFPPAALNLVKTECLRLDLGVT